jgi:hypothetical protein
VLGFADRQGRLRVMEALELRARQFRSRADSWPFRLPHEPLDLDEIVRRALDGQGAVDRDALRSRTVLEFLWDSHVWELWAIALPSGILLYCDSDGEETRVLASAKRGNPGEADGFLVERLAESRGELFGIEMSGPAPDRVRSSIGDRAFLADVLVEMFEGTPAELDIVDAAAEGDIEAAPEESDSEPRTAARDFRQHVERWLELVLTAPAPARRQRRVREAEAAR